MQESYVVITHLLKIPITELQFRTSRSGGHGGQNVNKLETRVELLFDVSHSYCISDQLRQRLLSNLSSRLDSSGILRIVAQDSRSQWKNKQIAIGRLTALFKSALKVRKKRVSTKPTKTAREDRIRTKKARGETKRLRKVVIE
jgi:ribosome-associated protein